MLAHAQPILTPVERLRRADQQILHVLTYKQQALAGTFCSKSAFTTDSSLAEWGSYELTTEGLQTLEKLADSLGAAEISELRQQASSRELILAAVVHANRLLDAINQGELELIFPVSV